MGGLRETPSAAEFGSEIASPLFGGYLGGAEPSSRGAANTWSVPTQERLNPARAAPSGQYLTQAGHSGWTADEARPPQAGYYIRQRAVAAAAHVTDISHAVPIRSLLIRLLLAGNQQKHVYDDV